jgi:hypothetical protein
MDTGLSVLRCGMNFAGLFFVFVGPVIVVAIFSQGRKRPRAARAQPRVAQPIGSRTAQAMQEGRARLQEARDGSVSAQGQYNERWQGSLQAARDRLEQKLTCSYCREETPAGARCSNCGARQSA